jgi:hypothetical protein
MFNQPSQVWMRDVLCCGDLSLYANVLTGIKMQFQSYNVGRRYTVWPRNPGCATNCALATNGNFGTNDKAPIQRSFCIRWHKTVGIRVDSHTPYQVSSSLLRSLSRNLKNL